MKVYFLVTQLDINNSDNNIKLAVDPYFLLSEYIVFIIIRYILYFTTPPDWISFIQHNYKDNFFFRKTCVLREKVLSILFTGTKAFAELEN